jgi:Domain of unknown function (DUF4265)
MSDEPCAKIALVGGNGEVETLWAHDLGSGRYRLDNLPWYAYGISVGDVVEAVASDGGQFTFSRIVEKSGNRTLRIILLRIPDGDQLTFESESALPILTELGCGFEKANRRFIAVNVPASVDLAAVTEALETTDVRWEYADPTPEDMGILPDDSEVAESSSDDG